MDALPSARTRQQGSTAIQLNRAAYLVSRAWFLWLLLATGLWVGLPWLAPVFMQLGWIGPARAIYFIYSLQCHQLPQRSFFLFGPKPMYSLAEIQTAWMTTLDPVVLRQFVGSPDMGYKVAWSDRMVSLYTSVPLGALLWWPLRRRLRPLPLWWLPILALPIVVDGGTHFLSDLAGIGQGFRDTNQWLAALTGYRFPPTYYAGDALGSFNSWIRLITGPLFGVGLAWSAMPYLHASFSDAARQIKAKFERAGVGL
ncbi:MAG: hypothetical protein A2Z37_16970 [Chloroflexi bacterium RBG_19FT_COMBO_62_14]|nr:MAG: hypothetical protein A2Z37_16970 [Chloroflexi bacterium RBG_19FT_COMBO_62_14]